VEAAGFTVVGENVRVAGGVEVTFVAEDRTGRQWFFDVSGAFTANRSGLQHRDALWKAIGRAATVQHAGGNTPFVLVTTEKPAPNSVGGRALSAVIGSKVRRKPIYDVIGLLVDDDLDRLRTYGRVA
jgi:hypothetical protein